METRQVGEAAVDICPKCEGQFFDMGDLFVALGSTADPSYWDRDGVAGALREAGMKCPRCHGALLQQEIQHSGKRVEIERCGKCAGLFLEKGEEAQLTAIGTAGMASIAAQKRRAESELAKMEDPDFSGGILNKFLGLFFIFGKKDDEEPQQ
jgi:Zn-finger nucleic acid-binding protein